VTGPFAGGSQATAANAIDDEVESAGLHRLGLAGVGSSAAAAAAAAAAGGPESPVRGGGKK
jgi:fructoselysine-6-P-deglycase FrlB-like protein